MLALRLRFLTGRYAATAYNDRGAAEWPPHPARLYSALVDALHTEDDVDPAERRALERLAAQPAPTVICSEAHARRVMTFFVPVNDQAVTDAAELTRKEAKLRAARATLAALPADGKARRKAERVEEKAATSLAAAAAKIAAPVTKRPKENPGPKVLPWGRTRQARTFPVVIPSIDTLSFLWPSQDLTEEDLDALARLSSRVVRLGHSSSFVHVRVDPNAAPAVDEEDQLDRWVPHDAGELVLRLPQPGQLQALEAQHAIHGGDLPGRVLPARFARYSRFGEGARVAETRRSRGRWIVYALQGQRLPPASAAVALSDAFREVLIEHATQPAHPMLSGRDEDGPLGAAHLAFLPLPFVGHPHADGAIRGLALSLPAAAADDADRALLEALGHLEAAGDPDLRELTLRMGGRALLLRRLVDPEAGLKSLRWDRWSEPSRCWATVTPIALDGECAPLNHPDPARRRKAQRTAAKLVRRAVLREVLPPGGTAWEPSEIGVRLIFDAPSRGAAHLRRVPAYRRPGHARPRRLVHALIDLPIPLRGPLVLGCGRHFGLGLCAPRSDNFTLAETTR